MRRNLGEDYSDQSESGSSSLQDTQGKSKGNSKGNAGGSKQAGGNQSHEKINLQKTVNLQGQLTQIIFDYIKMGSVDALKQE